MAECLSGFSRQEGNALYTIISDESNLTGRIALIDDQIEGPGFRGGGLGLILIKQVSRIANSGWYATRHATDP